MNRDEYVATLKEAALTIGTKSIVGALIAGAPFFGWPIVKQITETVIGFILDYAINKTEVAAFFLYVDLRVSKQGRDFFEAAKANKAAKTPEEKASAEKLLKDKFRALVRLTA